MTRLVKGVLALIERNIGRAALTSIRAVVVIVAAVALTLPAAAQQLAQAAGLTDGEVRRVDKEAKKLTIKHGPIANLDMPAMTMVFQVKDAALLEQVKAGDRIRFVADKINGAYIVTRIEK